MILPFHKAIHKSDRKELDNLFEKYQLPDEKRKLCLELHELANQSIK